MLHTSTASRVMTAAAAAVVIGILISTEMVICQGCSDRVMNLSDFRIELDDDVDMTRLVSIPSWVYDI